MRSCTPGLHEDRGAQIGSLLEPLHQIRRLEVAQEIIRSSPAVGEGGDDHLREISLGAGFEFALE
jgi:hypothetical protein